MAARKAVLQAWDAVGLERLLESVPFACPGGGGGQRPTEVRLPSPFAQTTRLKYRTHLC